MKKKVTPMPYAAIIVALLVQFATVPAQNIIYEIQGVKTEYSLIREYNDSYEVIFNHCSGTSSFLLADYGNLTATEVFMSDPVDILDMEIEGKTLYFCGIDKRDSSAFLGFINIPGTFIGADPITIVPIYYDPTATLYNGSTYDTVKGQFIPSKLEPYMKADHIFLIADVVYDTDEFVLPDYSVIIDARCNGGSWNFDFITEPDKVYYFNDLTVTDRYLIVVGNKHNGTGEYMHGYALPTSWLNQIFYTPLPSYAFPYIQYWSDSAALHYYPISKPLIETTTDDGFAVACHGKFGNNTGVVVTTYSSIGAMVNRCIVPNVTGTREFKDFKFNPIESRLYLMPDKYNSVVTNNMYDFNLTGSPSRLSHSVLPELHSLDIVKHIGSVASGKTNNQLLGVWKMLPGSSNCNGFVMLPPTNYHDSKKAGFNPTEKDNMKSANNQYYPQRATREINTLCIWKEE